MLTDAQRQTVAENMPLVFWAIGRATAATRDYLGPDELYEVATDALIEAVAMHDPAKGELSTLYSSRVFWKFRDAVRVAKRSRVSRRVHANVPDRGPGVESEADNRDECGHLLAGLCPADREILRLRWQDGLRLVEIAARYGISKEGARQRVERAMSRVREVAGANHSAR